jgi:hypothetical protein
MELQVTGQLWLREPTQTEEEMRRLASFVGDNDLPVKLELNKDGKWQVTVTGLEEGDEEHFLRTLAQIGKELPGLLFGGFEVWWPFVIESGPQRWVLDKEGHLKIYESSITWDEPREIEA